MESKGTARLHTRLLAFPNGQLPPGGRLDAVVLEPRRQSADLVIDYRELQFATPPVLFERGGKRWEQVHGVHCPRRLRFIDVQLVDGELLLTGLQAVSRDDPARSLIGALAWRAPGGQNYYLFDILGKVFPSLLLTARACVAEEADSPTEAASFARHWSPAPLSAARLVPNPRRLRARYGGDPITIRLGDRLFLRRLFIGGVDVQGKERPDVHVVLNVGEELSRWVASGIHHPADRWENKGEGSEGMDVAEIAREAQWVIERLQAGQRVLVHCAAGMNRSATICCATLIMLEGLPAEDALVRVRQQHPWARPDPRHWIELRWLAHTTLPGVVGSPTGP